jgi:hypothetical protein
MFEDANAELEALLLSKQAASERKELTLQATVSNKPNSVLTFKPTSSDFVLSDSAIWYVRLESAPAKPGKKDANTAARPKLVLSAHKDPADIPGIHDIARMRSNLVEELVRYRPGYEWQNKWQNKWRIRPPINYDTYDIAGNSHYYYASTTYLKGIRCASFCCMKSSVAAG